MKTRAFLVLVDAEKFYDSAHQGWFSLSTLKLALYDYFNVHTDADNKLYDKGITVMELGK